jgi:uncharacterized protein
MSTVGTFVWHDMMTTDAKASEAFYGQLFPEWQLRRIELPGMGSYSLIEVDGSPIGTIMPLEAPGVPSHWVGYVAVDDCDATVAQMVKLGGKLCYPAYHAPGVGKFAFVMDPEGAYIKPIQLEKSSPERSPAVGIMCWGELMSKDIDKAKAFYCSVFGWEAVTKPMPMVPGGAYTLFRNNGKDIAGGMTLQPGDGPPPSWLYYLLVDDVDDRARGADTLGGKVCMGPMDIPGVGRFAILIDPAGAMFALFKPLPKEA